MEAATAGRGSPRNLPGEDFIFVTGASRSGTTMLSRMIGNCVDVLPLKELHYFGELVPASGLHERRSNDDLVRAASMVLARQDRDFWVRHVNTAELASARQIVQSLPEPDRTSAGLFVALMKHLCHATGHRRVCEQTPRNIFYAGAILSAFPAAQIVHVVRDPRAVLASQKNRYRLRSLAGPHVPRSEVLRLWFNYHPYTTTRLWREATSAAIRHADSDRVSIVRYEDLVTDPDAVLCGLCEQLKLPYSRAMIDVPRWGSSNIGHDHAERGVASATLDKWREVLTAAEIAYSEQKTRDERARFGYEDSGAGGQSIPGSLRIWLRYPLHLAGVLAVNPRRMLIQIRALLSNRSDA